MTDSLQHRLQERVKELTALHGMARLLQDSERSLDQLLAEVLALLPAWQYPECTEGRIRLGESAWTTPGFQETDWLQKAEIRLRDGQTGDVTVVYTENRPQADDGPFLVEERDLIRSLADMLRVFFQHRRDDEAILAANERLEREVADRTAALRRLASEVCLAEERERRQIAENLHDHLGQGLAVIKMRLQNLKGDAVLGGHGDALEDLISLSDQAIRYTRGLTFELSPPVLYELGLSAALDWLAEQTQRKHGLKVRVKGRLKCQLPDDIRVMFWKSARELLHNVIKHAEARKVTIQLEEKDGLTSVTVEDDGCGFDPEEARNRAGDHFGLFSIEVRIRQLGGDLRVDTRRGRGSSVRLETPTPKGTP